MRVHMETTYDAQMPRKLKLFNGGLPFEFSDNAPISTWADQALDFGKQWHTSRYIKHKALFKPPPIPPDIFLHSHTALDNLWTTVMRDKTLWNGFEDVGAYDYVPSYHNEVVPAADSDTDESAEWVPPVALQSELQLQPSLPFWKKSDDSVVTCVLRAPECIPIPPPGSNKRRKLDSSTTPSHSLPRKASRTLRSSKKRPGKSPSPPRQLYSN